MDARNGRIDQLVLWCFPEAAYDESQRSKATILYRLWTLTSCFMWAYANFSIFYLKHFEMSLIGSSMSLIHVAAPLIGRWTRSVAWASFTVAITGHLWIAGFAYYCGGIYAPSLFYVAIPATVMGICAGLRPLLGFIGIVVVTLSYFQWQSEALREASVLPDFLWSWFTFTGGLGCAVILAWMVGAHLSTQNRILRKLRRSDSDNRELLRILGHDLANSLTIIQSAALLAKSKPETAGLRIERIQVSSSNAVELLRRIREWRALEDMSGLGLQERISLEKVFDVLKNIFEERASEKKISLNFRSDPDLHVLGDKVALTNQILANLVSNALKFSEDGGEVIVTARATVGDSVEIEVRDQGIGIPKELLKKLTGKGLSSSVSRRGTQGEKGTGFGFALVQSYTGRMGGALEVESFSSEDGCEQTGTLVRVKLKNADSLQQARTAA